jgi:hypothetical protein
MVDQPQEDGSAFNDLLGEFGKHGDREKRAKAERLAMMKPGDGRRNRGVKRPNQFNVRVSDATKAQADALIKEFSARDNRAWSQADLVEHAIAFLAQSQQKGTGTK